jgi:hypothetical protein
MPDFLDLVSDGDDDDGGGDASGDGSESDEYYVERVTDMRRDPDRHWVYHVKWVGYEDRVSQALAARVYRPYHCRGILTSGVCVCAITDVGARGEF